MDRTAGDGQKRKRAVTDMLRPVATIVAAAALCVAALALPTSAQSREGTIGATAAAVVTPADVSAQKARRTRKPAVRRVAVAAPPPPYYTQCFLFFCSTSRSGSAHPFPFLMLGVAY
jgi:hypothetical protein